jgi:hypothetical protein
MKGTLFECWGCGGSNCSMCAVGESKSEQEAIADYIRMFGIQKFIRLANSKGLLVTGDIDNLNIKPMKLEVVV